MRTEPANRGAVGRRRIPAIPEVQPGAGDRFGAGLRANAATFRGDSSDGEASSDLLAGASKTGYRGSRGPPVNRTAGAVRLEGSVRGREAESREARCLVPDVRVCSGGTAWMGGGDAISVQAVRRKTRSEERSVGKACSSG